MSINENETPSVKWFTAAIISFVVLITVVVVGGIIMSNRQLRFFESDCADAGGSRRDLGSVSICVDNDGRVINVERRFF